MILMLEELIRRSGGTDMQYFESAYYWKYGKLVNVFGDILAYRTQGHVPRYVQEYIKHVEKSM